MCGTSRGIGYCDLQDSRVEGVIIDSLSCNTFVNSVANKSRIRVEVRSSSSGSRSASRYLRDAVLLLSVRLSHFVAHTDTISISWSFLLFSNISP